MITTLAVPVESSRRVADGAGRLGNSDRTCLVRPVRHLGAVIGAAFFSVNSLCVLGPAAERHQPAAVHIAWRGRRWRRSATLPADDNVLTDGGVSRHNRAS